MRRTSFAGFHCSLARTLELIGDWWTPLVLRDLYLGLSRFDELADDLGISRNLLAARLAGLVEHGLVERTPYADHPRRYDYVLSAAGRDLVPALLALTAWGDRTVPPPGGPPLYYRHHDCGARFTPVVACSECGAEVHADDLDIEPGPGGRSAPGTAVVAERIARRHGPAARSGGLEPQPFDP